MAQGLAEGVTIGSQLVVQVSGILSVGAYTAVLTYVLLKLVGMMTGGLRVTSDQETQGLDVVLHNESGYDI